MILLALDTSTRQASVALWSAEKLYGEHTWQASNNHSVEMLEHIQRLLAASGLELAALDGLAVALGPGSFNGVRVAVAAGKALAFALQRPLVGLSTLEISAAGHPFWSGPICPVLEAGRGELYAGCFLNEAPPTEGIARVPGPRQLANYQVLSPAGLASYLAEELGPLLRSAGVVETAPILFCGEISVASRQALAAGLPGRALFAPAPEGVRHASTLARLALQRIAGQQLDDPLALEPLYLRRPNITTSTRKQPLLGQQPGSSGQSADQYSTEREEGALRH